MTDEKSLPSPLAMLYSAEAITTVESILEHVGRAVKLRARNRAMRDGRTLIDDDDVWAALDGINFKAMSAELDDLT